ncbi:MULTISPECIES: hypothetical protein [Dehalococcoides]|jgi:hypothetical protein|uniref:Uncharacterized protein n=1 Tax=Dehalococcoides mccartyi (strain VS) TaxID=311424 RepID=D2BIN3_DEHMV|nr:MULTISPECIES: hypothetical protein [Dehalococcoides]ACZ62183.1 hypothetical protein DhcVS_1066 [Dehalococcoides mccartyi VS]AHB13887.1 hypothetical protein GY50_1116 [Dehalococcoides mccartyi GY50]AII58240.1 hypothetical protein X792_05975 [Dehalococcoides mccartyi CG1]APH12818.1 hypothetical protein ASJ33_06450 [Dehalococcoides mccartyi]QYY57759.1 hypothetical protein CWV2_001014 [Dehalococcoides mccartyi]
MALGNIYLGDQLIGQVEYTLQDNSDSRWWGELVFTEYHKVADGGGYSILTEDGKQGRCTLKKKLNKAVYGMPSRHFYLFQGMSPLKTP